MKLGDRVMVVSKSMKRPLPPGEVSWYNKMDGLVRKFEGYDESRPNVLVEIFNDKVPGGTERLFWQNELVVL